MTAFYTGDLYRSSEDQRLLKIIGKAAGSAQIDWAFAVGDGVFLATPLKILAFSTLLNEHR